MTPARCTATSRSIRMMGATLVCVAVGLVNPFQLRAQTFPEQLGRWALGDTTEVDLGPSVVVFNRGPVLMVEEIGDVPDPRSGEIDLGEIVQDLALVGTIAWALGEAGALLAVDVEDPERLAIVGSVHLSEREHSLAANEEIVSVSGLDGLVVVDVFDPSRPLVVGAVSWERALGANTTMDNDMVFVADGDAATIVDVSVPSAPQVLKRYSSSVYDVDIAGTLMYAIGRGWLKIIDVADPANPSLVWSLRVIYDVDYGRESVSVSEGVAVASSDQSFGSAAVIDVSTPTEPAVISEILVNGKPSEVMVLDGRCAVASASYWEGDVLSFLDLSFPARPVMQWSIELPGEVRTVAVAGDIVVAGTDQGLVTLDVSDSESVRVLGTLPLDDSPTSIEISGSVAFVVGPAWGVKAVDFSEPSQPIEVGTLLTWGSAYDLTINGRLLFIADDHRGLAVVDASNPADMVTITRWNTAHPARVVAHEGTLLALGCTGRGSGVLLFDVSDPERPMRIGELSPGIGAQDLNIKNGLLYAARGGGGVYVFDVNDPYMPTEVTRIPCTDTNSGWVRSLTVVGDQLWFSEGNTWAGTLKVYNVSNPSMPILAGEAPFTGITYSIAAGIDGVATAGTTGVRLFGADTRVPVPRRPDGRGGD